MQFLLINSLAFSKNGRQRDRILWCVFEKSPSEEQKVTVRGTEFYGVFLTKKNPAARVDFFNGSHASFGRAGDEQL